MQYVMLMAIFIVYQVLQMNKKLQIVVKDIALKKINGKLLIISTFLLFHVAFVILTKLLY